MAESIPPRRGDPVIAIGIWAGCAALLAVAGLGLAADASPGMWAVAGVAVVVALLGAWAGALAFRDGR